MTRLNKQEFQAWAYDDLLTNTTRGVLAEYIVATALGIRDTKRVEWVTAESVRQWKPKPTAAAPSSCCGVASALVD